MAFAINQVFLAGARLVRDPELRQVGESRLASFSVAVGRGVKQPDGTWRDEADFFDVERWNISNGLLASLTKGTQVAISGRLRQERWRDKTTDKQRSRVVIQADQIILEASPKSDGVYQAPPEERQELIDTSSSFAGSVFHETEPW